MVLPPFCKKGSFCKAKAMVFNMAFHMASVGDVRYIRSDILVSRHGFSTRLGGVSAPGATASLNLAFGRGDERETVLENLTRFGDAVGFDPKGVVSVPQIHGRDVFLVDSNHRGMGYWVDAPVEGDGYVTADPAVVLGVNFKLSKKRHRKPQFHLLNFPAFLVSHCFVLSFCPPLVFALLGVNGADYIIGVNHPSRPKSNFFLPLVVFGIFPPFMLYFAPKERYHARQD